MARWGGSWMLQRWNLIQDSNMSLFFAACLTNRESRCINRCGAAAEGLPQQAQLAIQGHRAPEKQSSGLFLARWGRKARGTVAEQATMLPSRGRMRSFSSIINLA